MPTLGLTSLVLDGVLDVLNEGWAVLLGLVAGLAVLVRGLRGRIPAIKLAAELVAVVHLSGVIAVAFFPFPIQRELIEAEREAQFAHNNFFPLVSLLSALGGAGSSSVIYQSAGNFVMLMPMGIYLPFISRRYRGLLLVGMAGLATAAAIEVAQFGISAVLGYTYKITDVDDLILNTSGVLVGYVLFRAAARLAPELMRDADDPAAPRTVAVRDRSLQSRRTGG